MTTDFDNVGGTIKTPDTADASTTECPICGVAIDGIAARAPGQRTLEPCGHETGFLRASQMMELEKTTSGKYRAKTDGGHNVEEHLHLAVDENGNPEALFRDYDTAKDAVESDSYRFENVADVFPDVPLLTEEDR